MQVLSSSRKDVYLLIYKVCFLQFFTYDHTEVRIIGDDVQMDVSWSREGLAIDDMEDRIAEDIIGLRRIYCGTVDIEDDDIYRTAVRIGRQLRSYSLIYRNCRHYSQKFLAALRPTEVYDAMDFLLDSLRICSAAAYVIRKLLDLLIKKMLLLYYALLWYVVQILNDSADSLINRSTSYLAQRTGIDFLPLITGNFSHKNHAL